MAKEGEQTCQSRTSTAASNSDRSDANLLGPVRVEQAENSGSVNEMLGPGHDPKRGLAQDGVAFFWGGGWILRFELGRVSRLVCRSAPGKCSR